MKMSNRNWLLIFLEVWVNFNVIALFCGINK